MSTRIIAITLKSRISYDECKNEIKSRKISSKTKEVFKVLSAERFAELINNRHKTTGPLNSKPSNGINETNLCQIIAYLNS